MEERNYKVYVHENKTNHKKYIGITRRPLKWRWGKEGRNYGKTSYIRRAFDKYGWDNFEHKLLLCNLTMEEAEMFEKELIKYYKTTQIEFGYNIALGGMVKKETSVELRKRISKGKCNSGIESEKIICLDNKIVYNSPIEAALELGLKCSFITEQLKKDKIKSVKGYHFILLKDYNPNKIYDLSTGVGRSIVCTDTGEVFSSAKECAKKMKFKTNSVILEVCKGRVKHAYGYHFKFLEDYNPLTDKTERTFVGRNKRVICTDTGVIYKNATECGKALGIEFGAVARVCKGTTGHVNGYHFKYYTEGFNIKENKTERELPKIIKIKCLETGEEFESIAECARKMGADQSEISKVCRGIKKSNKGFHFVYNYN